MGPPLPDHAPKLLRTCQPQVFRVAVFDPDQHDAGLSTSGNHDSFTLGTAQDSVQVCVQLFFRDAPHTISSVGKDATLVERPKRLQFLESQFVNDDFVGHGSMITLRLSFITSCGVHSHQL